MIGVLSTDREDWTDLSKWDVVGLLVIVAVLAVVVAEKGGLVLYPFLLVSGLWLIYDGFTRWQQLRLVEDTAPEPVRSIAVGQTEVRGTCEPLDEPVERPFSKGECVLAYWEVEEYDDGWKTLGSGVRYAPFVIDDGTGSIRVEPPADATTRMSDRNETEITVSTTGILGRGSEPEAVVEFLESRDDIDAPSSGLLFRPQRRYTETVVPPGEDVYVLGGTSIRENAEGSNPERLVLSRDEATDKFIVSDLSQEEFVGADRSWAGAEVVIGLALVAITSGLIVLQFGGG